MEMAPMLTLYRLLQQQYDGAIDPRLECLYRAVVVVLMQIHQAEALYLWRIDQLLNQIRPHLEQDSRCVLPSVEFHDFIKQFLVDYRSSASREQKLWVRASPSTWLLNRLEVPLQLGEYELIEDKPTAAFRLTAEWGSWRHTVEVTIARANSRGAVERWSIDEQWAEVVAQLPSQFADLPVGEQAAQLVQEIACLICFAGSLLSVMPKSTWFTYS